MPKAITLASLLIGGHQIDRLLAHWGYTLVFGLVALQSAGVPLPGGTALVSAAIYAGTTHRLTILGVIAAAAVGAVVGDAVGFALGRWGGWRLLRRYGPHVRLSEERLRLGRYLFLRHGGKVVFFGRFITGLRTWAAFLAGANRMAWDRFLLFNVSGGVVWAVLTGLGYFYFGHVLSTASTGVNVVLAVAAVAWVAATLTYLRTREASLQSAADRALSELEPEL